MAKRRSFTASDVPLVGGALVLDFVNTTGNRDTRPRERLGTYADLVIWSTRVDLLDQRTAELLLSRGNRDPGAAAQALNKGLEVREVLYAVLNSIALYEVPAKESVQQFEQWLKQSHARRMLIGSRGRVSWSHRVTPNQLDSILWPILWSAEAVLTRCHELKRCGECDWLFLDDTKNKSRQWCKKLCADRVRARRYYATTKS